MQTSGISSASFRCVCGVVIGRTIAVLPFFVVFHAFFGWFKRWLISTRIQFCLVSQLGLIAQRARRATLLRGVTQEVLKG